jgi:uncharacterized protein
MTMANEAEKSGAGRAACPVCGQPRAERYRPFCSKRCADVDLQRWLSGRYAIPAAEDEEGSSVPDGRPGQGDEV